MKSDYKISNFQFYHYFCNSVKSKIYFWNDSYVAKIVLQ